MRGISYQKGAEAQVAFISTREILIANAGRNIRHEVDLAYQQFMLEKYGRKVIDELELLDRINSYHGKILGIELMYKKMYEELK